ncbi:MAG: hypothetical protein QOE23_1760 [Pseudonocardiales bacterium]|jgi:hypothetical protein|nr:hypothetical protein [Pseudonocardiales bacterium]
MNTEPRRLSLLLCAVLALTVACSPDAKDTGAAAPVTSQPSSSAPATSTAATSAAAPTASRPATAASSASPVPSKPSSAPASTASTAPAGPIDGPGGCPTAVLKIEALRGSGAAGHQYAFVQFTNSSKKACSLTGYPGVQLVRAGKPMGQPAVRSGKPIHRVQLAPGHSVTAQLVDASTCEADKSDSVAIYPPNRTERVVVPLSLRGCALTIDPVVAS